MSTTKERNLTRDVAAIQIPSGDRITIPAGTLVQITQTLGGSYTVMTDVGLARVDGKDADALGETVVDQTVNVATREDGSPEPEALWEQLKQVYDPEIPVNIVDLGLVYSLDVETAETGGFKVTVAMTLTAPGCGMGPAIAEDARGKLLVVPGVNQADVNLTWDPPWNQSMISEEGRMKLGLV